MRNAYSRLAGLTIGLALVAAPVLAAKPTVHGKPAGASVHGASQSAVKIKTTSPAAAKAKPPKPVKPVKASTPAAASKTKGKPTTPTTTTTTSSPTPSAPGVFVPTNPVAQKLSTKSNLMARVQSKLPAGTDLNAATAGFKNFGQFIAATNVSSNLGIDFGKLKSAMTGTDLAGLPTGQPTVSLGQAIQKLKPGTDGDAEALRAEKLADEQIAGSGAQ